ncbi:GNAT family N-acetyltransferase [Thermoflavimicrobium dichotomicum]|uniref:Protein N-acetyltransferase, RimJ/RimL family n=1 Tax=Thermoflavimicrobium dichotomicum TaxID=46223 RepID=A0A1I3U5F8_9BACL|nr:GNAT family protein [Thermoflavimicrobium dichotomicum]SFJ78764.1 Protein N-acetyltransferase, RimJ/RimL family [Thermoflavimicrobium dichotomicum]
MDISFQAFTSEVDELIHFLTSETWEYHGQSNLSAQEIMTAYQNEKYTGDGNQTFWILFGEKKAGLIRIFDLHDPTPLFDLRILKSYRGREIGEVAVKWLTDYIFTHYPEKTRIEGTTRQDNWAMRKVFHKCGFVKESHYRKAWPSQDGRIYDAVGYAILREDWEEKKTTPVDWNDFEYEHNF